MPAPERYAALTVVRDRIRVGAPLPFNVRDADRTLLLARGQRIDSGEHLQALFERGALVDFDEIRSAADAVRELPREELPRRWNACLGRVAQALRHAPHAGFRAAVDDAAAPVLALIDRDPDLAIFQVLRGERGEAVDYGVRRSLASAITAFLVAQRLAWDARSMERAFKVALTMNVSMLELQGELSRQCTPLSGPQLEALRTHPLRSAEMLELSGVADADWLRAVRMHHEVEDGSGYPEGCSEVGELASLARRADVYTAKLASRQHRDALAADVAGRQMFMRDPGHPMTAALVKEFGIYPPGCCVRLKSGETGFVVARGPVLTAPVVACFAGADGRPLREPRRVDTGDARHAVVAIVGESGIDAAATADRLMALSVIR